LILASKRDLETAKLCSKKIIFLRRTFLKWYKKITSMSSDSKEENSEESAISERLLKAYLKEWGLCQDNLKRHNDWVWQVGAIFIALSLGAMWVTTQIEKVGQHMIVLRVSALFSILTMIFWGFISWRARFYMHWTKKRLEQIEKRLRNASNLEYENCEKLLHSLIKEKDNEFGSPPRVRWITLIFIIMVIISWIVLLLHYEGILF
jgi:hypothetical protein